MRKRASLSPRPAQAACPFLLLRTIKDRNNSLFTFVYPPAVITPIEQVTVQFNECLGSAYIIAYLRAHGYQADQYVTKQPVNINRCVRDTLAGNPRIVGFTVYGTNYGFCQLIARRLKEADPGLILIFGGPSATVQADVLLEDNPCVDICVSNEGEETSLELLTILDDTGFNFEKAVPRLEKVKGISYRRDGQAVHNPPRDLLLSNHRTADFLDRYPSPYLSGLLTSPKLGLITARGCTKHCVYCNCAVLSKRIIATHSVDRVVEELTYISKHMDDSFTGTVDIFDDAFTLRPDRAREICQRLIDQDISLPMTCATRCDNIDEDLLVKMKQAGFESISFSLESAVPRVLREIGKLQPPNTKADPHMEREKDFIRRFKKYVLFAREIGIRSVNASIMIGLPTETREEGQETIDLIRSLGSHLFHYSHNLFRIYPGTPIHKNYQEYGLTRELYKNRVHFETGYPYDVASIAPLANSNLVQGRIKRDKMVLKHLALKPPRYSRTKGNSNSSGTAYGDFIHRVIFCGNELSEELINWFQDNLAVNGPLIQIYSDRETADRFYHANQHALSDYMAPTNYLISYYRKKQSDGSSLLVPYRFHLMGDHCGFAIHLLSTASALTWDDNSSESKKAARSVCLDSTVTVPHENVSVAGKESGVDDPLFLLLKEIAHEGVNLENVMMRPIYPYFAGLCKWQGRNKQLANCKTLESVIIDQDLQLKTCWHGEAVGRVGMSISEITANLEEISRKLEKERNCGACVKHATCARCLFPAPLNEAHYCRLKRESDTEEAAAMVADVDFLKDI